MAPISRGCLERLRRAVRTAIFLVALVGSLLISSLPVVLVAACDIALPFAILSSLVKSDGEGFMHLIQTYSFRSSVIDFPFVSSLRSVIILCLYSFSDISSISHGPYLSTVSFCALISVVVLAVKTWVSTLSSLSSVLFFSSIVFALGHVLIAYRSSCGARRKLFLYNETLLSWKRVPKSSAKFANNPSRLIADSDSLFVNCNGLAVHYRVAFPNGNATRGNENVGIVLIHDFGGEVSSWRRFMSVLSEQTGCKVVAFDRVGWGLTSRPRRKIWEDKKLPNPYALDSQADLLLSFCLEMGFSSVILVGHDDGGLVGLKAVQKASLMKCCTVAIRGIVLANLSLRRDVVPSFARILLRNFLGKNHLVRPLRRTEILRVVTRSACLISDTLKLYKGSLFVEGWEEAKHDAGKAAGESVATGQTGNDVIGSVGLVPVLVVAGGEDSVVTVEDCKELASRFDICKFEVLSECGYFSHEECPNALVGAIVHFARHLLNEEV